MAKSNLNPKKTSKKNKIKTARTEDEKRRNVKAMTIYMSVVLGILVGYVFSYAYTLADKNNTTLLKGLIAFKDNLMEMKIFFMPTAASFKGILFGAIFGIFAFLFISIDNERNDVYTMTESAGSGRFMSAEEMDSYANKYISKDPPPITEYPIKKEPWETQKEKYSKNMIMSNNFCRPINSRALIGNNNVLIVGGAGTGKSRFVIKPNMLQMNASYIITDPSGEMIYSLGKVLSNNGYKILVFNIANMGHSNCYNPLRYIRDEAGVNMLIQCLINNTQKGDAGENQFFVDAEKLLYSACIFYLKDYCMDESMKNFAGVMTLINSSSVDEANANAKSPLDKLFDRLPKSSLAWKYYKAFKQAAGKTLKSIIISCVTRLQPFLTPQVANLTKTDSLHLESIGKEKTALFIVTPQADRTYSFLASMLYSQLFETLYHEAEQQKIETGSEELPIPVRCLMDEFANIGEVPEFPSKLATMRKYNISATIVLQDISQIEAMYKDEWRTLVSNCVSIIFLGTSEPNTLEYFTKKLGEMTIRTKSTGISEGKSASHSKNFQYTSRKVLTEDELGRLDKEECIVFTQNMRPVRDLKYRYERHPYYSQTADADTKNGFNYTALSVYDNRNAAMYSNITVAVSHIANLKKMKSKITEEMEDKVVKGPAAKVINDMKFTDSEKEAIYRNGLVECQDKVFATFDDPVSVVVVENIPSKFLVNIADGTAKVFSGRPLIILSKMTSDNIYIGVCVDDTNGNGKMNRAVNNDYIKSSKVIKNKEKHITIVMLYENNIEQFKNAVFDFYKNNEELIQIEKQQ